MKSLRSAELTVDLQLAHLHPGARTVLAEDVDLRVDELTVLEHLLPRLAAGVAEGRAKHQLRARLARGETIGPDRPDEMLSPRLVFADPPEDRVDLDPGDIFLRDVLELERDAGNDLVLSVDHADVVPAGMDVSELEVLFDFPRAATPQAGGAQAESHHSR